MTKKRNALAKNPPTSRLMRRTMTKNQPLHKWKVMAKNPHPHKWKSYDKIYLRHQKSGLTITEPADEAILPRINWRDRLWRKSALEQMKKITTKFIGDIKKADSQIAESAFWICTRRVQICSILPRSPLWRPSLRVTSWFSVEHPVENHPACSFLLFLCLVIEKRREPLEIIPLVIKVIALRDNIPARACLRSAPVQRVLEREKLNLVWPCIIL